ncbi:MAG: aldo/keto reductase [Bacteroidales bacterium]|nr:aldo/keto reductase [Bacteroidales bacterium]
MNYKKQYVANPERYAEGVMNYRTCGASGIRLPEVSLGFWWNFGGVNVYEESLAKMTYAFDHGITCFDLANNYGPPFGSAEETFGRMYSDNFQAHRHEIIITTKAGYNMWEGPYGAGSSRKMLITSLDESLRRMHLDYVDIFYSHRYDGFTPIEETMQALVDIVRSGKALYVGLSNYPVDKLQEAVAYLKARDVRPLIYQGKYNLLTRDPEKSHLEQCKQEGMGFTAFSPINQGLLTDKYLGGIPADSRAGHSSPLLASMITPELVEKLRRLNEVAKRRGQSLAQMATAWILRREEVTSVIIGPRTVEQMQDSLCAIKSAPFCEEELKEIDKILAK